MTDVLLTLNPVTKLGLMLFCKKKEIRKRKLNNKRNRNKQKEDVLGQRNHGQPDQFRKSESG